MIDAFTKGERMKKVIAMVFLAIGLIGCGPAEVEKSNNATLTFPGFPIYTPRNYVDCPSSTTYSQANNDIGFFIDVGDSYTYPSFYGGYTGVEVRMVGDLVNNNNVWTHNDHVTQIVGQEYDLRQPLATRYSGQCFDITPSQWNVQTSPVAVGNPDTTYIWNFYEGFSSGPGNRHYIRMDAHKAWPGTDYVAMSFITFDQGTTWIQYVTPSTYYYPVYAWQEIVNE